MQLQDSDRFCSKCGYDFMTHQGQWQTPPCPSATQHNPNISDKNGLVVLLLAWFLGVLGIHSFYVGKTGVGIAQLFTLGGCGIWVIIDIIMLVVGNYHDGDGKLVKI
ncbi:hypothetical protein BN938_2266 [Mucinivorans hirudinis]|uniref:TM2 domain-containing protein n=1 Tax=Mucinivorans hirudinis TaxID=1433126 RepID=A0A060RDN0_9BACT|nr:hypothetical protein BN938_2266 [Mucinivorans hirudinis]